MDRSCFAIRFHRPELREQIQEVDVIADCRSSCRQLHLVLCQELPVLGTEDAGGQLELVDEPVRLAAFYSNRIRFDHFLLLPTLDDIWFAGFTPADSISRVRQYHSLGCKDGEFPVFVFILDLHPWKQGSYVFQTFRVVYPLYRFRLSDL